MLQQHIPHLLKSLEPVWAQWGLLGVALGITHSMSGHQATSCQHKLLSVIKVFGATTTHEECTWRKIHEAVTMLDKVNIANKIEEDHSNLDEPCKSRCTVITLHVVIVPKDRPAVILEAVTGIAYQWRMFGTYLGVPYHKLKEIEDPSTTAQECMLETLNVWINSKPKEATIHNLISAIRGPIIDNELLAQCIEGDPKIKDTFSL